MTLPPSPHSSTPPELFPAPAAVPAPASITVPPSRAEWRLAMGLGQRRLLAAMVGVVAIGLGVRLMIDRTTITDPQPPRGDRWAALADRLDPNTADWTELAALPAMGEKRAHALVAHRDAVHARDPSAIAYASPRDLYKVTGFGVAMVEQLGQYLKFPGQAATTSP